MSLDCEWIVLHRPLYLGRQQAFRTRENKGYFSHGRTGQIFRRPQLVCGANAHGAGRRAFVVQTSLLSHLMWCMIIQQMEATAYYLLFFTEKTKTLLLCCYGFVVFLPFFVVASVFQAWDLHFQNGALCENASSVQWHVEFYAWESCI